VNNQFFKPKFVEFYGDPEGGLFHISELDLANDNFRASLNVALENRKLATDEGLIPMSDKFYLMADGNTCGRGAHPAFPSHTAFDAAFAARFEFIEFEYDWPLAKYIAQSMNKHSGPIVDWAEKVSNWALANGIPVVMGPRECYKLTRFLTTTDLPEEKILNSQFRGLDISSKEKLLSNYPFPSITRVV
jgi:hypothetical protein